MSFYVDFDYYFCMKDVIFQR